MKKTKIVHKPCKPAAAIDIFKMRPSYTLDGELEKARWEVWKWNFNYNQLKLRAALKGEISPKRDARVSAAYASRRTMDNCRDSMAIIAVACSEIEQYASVKLDSKLADKALARIHGTPTPAPKPKVKKAQSQKAKLAEAKAFARKGFSIGYNHDGTWIMITPKNYKRSLDKLAAERIAADEAHAAKYADLGKCKCASHTTLGQGEFSKARSQSR